MKKFLKIVAIVAVVLIAVALVVPLALKSKVGDIVKKEAGELLTAEVDFRSLDLSLLRHFPHASVELEGLTVVCAAPFEGDTLASVGRISVVVDLMSLFGDSGYEVTKLLVDKAHLHARKLADGSVNWDVMKPSDEPAEEKEPAEADEPSAFRLRMRDVRLSEAVVRYEDDSTGMRAGVDPLDLRLSGDLSGERSDLDLRLEAHRLSYAAGGVALLRDADLTADVTLDADLKNKRFTFSDNRLSLNAIALSLDGWVALADDRTEMDVRVNSSKVEFRDVLSLVPAFYTRDFENLTASGQLTLDAWAKGVLAGDRLPAFETTLAVRDGSFKYASLPKAVTGITIDARAANPGGTADATTVDVPTFALTMAGNALRGSFSAATPMSDLRFKAAAAGKVDLGAVKEVYPLGDSIALAGVVTADMQASGRMSDIERERYEAIAAAGRLTVEGVTAALAGLPEVKVRRAAMSVSPAALTLSELGVTVGRSDIEASGTLSNYIGYLLRDQTLRGRLDVRSSLLDLNELLGDASEASADTGAAASGRYGGDACRRRAAEPRSGTRCVAEKDTVSENGARRFHRFSDRGEGYCLDEPAGDECLRRPDVGFGQLLDGSRRAAAGVEVEGRDRRCVVLDDLRPAGRRAPHGAPVREDGRGLLDVARSGDPPDADDGSRLCDLAGRRGDPFEEHPRAEYRRLRPVGRSAQKRRPAPHRGEGCRHPFHDPRRTHRHAALRSERGRYFAQPVGFDGAGSDDRLYGPGDAARRIGGRYSYGGRRRHRRQFLVAEDHARREECREGRREQCDR